MVMIFLDGSVGFLMPGFEDGQMVVWDFSEYWNFEDM
jgi:hypothetical protein